MNTDSLRASSANTYLDCPFKYYLINEIGFSSEAGSKALRGTIVHHVFQCMAQASKTGHHKLNDKYTDTNYLLKICWLRHTRENPQIKLTKEDYNFCVSQINYILASRFNPLKLKVLKTEHQFDIMIKRPTAALPDGKYIRFRGTVDLVTELDEDTLEVIDYKTGKRSDWLTGKEKGVEELVHDLQLRMYNLATKIFYPQYKKRIFTLIFTADGGPFTVSFDLDNPEETIQEFVALVHRIRNDQTLERLKDNRQDEIWKCKYVCQFGQYRHMYMSKDQDLLEKTYAFRDIKNTGIPWKVTENGKDYFKITDHTGTMCDQYHKVVKCNGKTAAKQILYQVKLGDDLDKVVSRRNDYNRGGITYAEIN